jgi:predicted MPP superfamily phosphohydrolase
MLMFFLLYGGMHLYAFLKAKAAFAFSAMTGIWVVLLMLVMICAPVIVRLSEKANFEVFSQIMSYIGYIWLGVLFLFISVSVGLDIYRLIIYSCGLVLKKDLAYLSLGVKYAFFVPLIVSSAVAVYGYFEARNVRTETVLIKSPKIPPEAGRLRIVQISDVHLGLIVREERLKRIVNEVIKAKPDILVSTGDLVDGQINNLAGLAEILRNINARYGKYAITGNHEFYAGLAQAIEFTRKAGFQVLRGEGVVIEGLINIVGVDDLQIKGLSHLKDISEAELLSGIANGKFTVLLKHRPLVDKSATGLFDLQLSGHVHKGQIFPFSLITALYYYPVQTGFAELPSNSYLYVSRGSGTWGPPIRFLSPPEITVIDLAHDDK